MAARRSKRERSTPSVIKMIRPGVPSWRSVSAASAAPRSRNDPLPRGRSTRSVGSDCLNADAATKRPKTRAAVRLASTSSTSAPAVARYASTTTSCGARPPLRS